MIVVGLTDEEFGVEVETDTGCVGGVVETVVVVNAVEVVKTVVVVVVLAGFGTRPKQVSRRKTDLKYFSRIPNNFTPSATRSAKAPAYQTEFLSSRLNTTIRNGQHSTRKRHNHLWLCQKCVGQRESVSRSSELRFCS